MKQKGKIVIMLLVIVFGAIFMNTYMNKQVYFSTYSIKSNRINQELSGYEIMQITDLHSIRSEEQKKMLIEKIKKKTPDIIVITGDLIDSNQYNLQNVHFELYGEERPEQKTLDFMEELIQLAPIYYIYGNHEMVLLDDPEQNKFKLAMEEMGVILLNNRVVTIQYNNTCFQLAGIQDPATVYKDILFSDSGQDNETRTKAMLDYITTELSAEQYTILLAHRSKYFDIYSSYPIDLAITGHAHGGQIRIPFVGGLYTPGEGWFPKYTSGVFETGSFSMIVGRGIGNSSFPLRVFNPPQIIMITLEADE